MKNVATSDNVFLQMLKFTEFFKIIAYINGGGIEKAVKSK